jgi:hypothetical protein
MTARDNALGKSKRTISARISWTESATRGGWCPWRDSFCSVCFEQSSQLWHAGPPDRPAPTWRAWHDDANHANCVPRNGRARPRLWRIGNILRWSSAGRRLERYQPSLCCLARRRRSRRNRFYPFGCAVSAANAPAVDAAGAEDECAPSRRCAVAGGDATTLLDLVEELLDQVARSVEISAEADCLFAISFRRDVCPRALLANERLDPVGVISSICQQHRSRTQSAEENRT